jgi:hypothetical protein
MGYNADYEILASQPCIRRLPQSNASFSHLIPYTAITVESIRGHLSPSCAHISLPHPRTCLAHPEAIRIAPPSTVLPLCLRFQNQRPMHSRTTTPMTEKKTTVPMMTPVEVLPAFVPCRPPWLLTATTTITFARKFKRNRVL